MSIIQDALKKAQADVTPPIPAAKTAQVIKPADPVRAVVEPVVQKTGISRRIPMIALSLVIIMLAILAAAGRFLHFTGGGSNRASEAPVQGISYKPLVTDEVKNSNQAADRGQPSISAGILNLSDRPDLVLNGIMYLEEGPRAIINNFIVEPGDLVNGAKVTKINPKNVILEYGNVEIILNLQ